MTLQNIDFKTLVQTAQVQGLSINQDLPQATRSILERADQAAGERRINAGGLADRGELLTRELALGLIGMLKNAARGPRQILVEAQPLDLGGLHQGLEVSVLKVQGLTLATGVAISQPWRSR